jgi:hypothetical protein
MPVSTNMEIAGIQDTLRALREIDPELQKEFRRNIGTVVAPMIADAKSKYRELPLSGMAYKWDQLGSKKFPWEAAQVRGGVKLKNSTRRNRRSVVYISQGNPAGAIFEVAGTGNPFGANLRSRNSPVLWPAYDKHSREIQAGIAVIVKVAEIQVQGMVNR